MKKQYITPLTEVVKIKAEKMLSGSDQIPVGDSVPGGQSGSGNILSKENEDSDSNLW